MKRFDLKQKESLKHPPFCIPDGYFEDFHSRLMAELPEIPAKKKTGRFSILFRPRVITAMAGAAILCAIFNIYTITDKKVPANPNAELLTAQETAQMVTDFCDYTRLKSSDIYYYVTSDQSGL